MFQEKLYIIKCNSLNVSTDGWQTQGKWSLSGNSITMRTGVFQAVLDNVTYIWHQNLMRKKQGVLPE